ncbi:MAG TPA: FHA domain-containing protein [Candidatus Limnocylindrales bacterium]
MPTGPAGGPSPAAWGWTPSTPPAYLSGDGIPPRPRLPIVATVLALCVGITFLLPWVRFDAFGISVSLSAMFEASDWIGRLWADLVVLGFLVAFISAFFDAFLRLGRRAAIAEALGFGAVGAGTVIGMASRFDSYFGDPGFGAWLCLLVAVTGVIAAVVRFAGPNAFTSTVAPFATAHYAPPFTPEHPGAWAPPHPSTPSGSTPYVVPVPSMPAALVSETARQAPAPDLPGALGTLVLLVAGQTTTRLVTPGELLLVGRDPNSGIVLADPRVSPRHASIERRGPGWLVRGLDVANPTWLLDATGRAQPIRGELGLSSGELLIGGAQVRLYPPSR